MVTRRVLLVAFLGASACSSSESEPGRWQPLASAAGYQLSVDGSSASRFRSGSTVWVGIDLARGNGFELRDSMSARYEDLRDDGANHEQAVVSTLSDLLSLRVEKFAARPATSVADPAILVELSVSCSPPSVELQSWRFDGSLGLPNDDGMMIAGLRVAPGTASEVIVSRLC
jgi:hypothetical protein